MDCTAEELARHINENLDKSRPAPRIAILCGGGAELARVALSGFLPDTDILVDDSRGGRALLLLQYIKEYSMLDCIEEDARLSAPLYIRKSDAEIKRAAYK
jgi:hypothetical protein